MPAHGISRDDQAAQCFIQRTTRVIEGRCWAPATALILISWRDIVALHGAAWQLEEGVLNSTLECADKHTQVGVDSLLLVVNRLAFIFLLTVR
jgi:hypothetical protein